MNLNKFISACTGFIMCAGVATTTAPLSVFADNTPQIFINEICTGNGGENNLTGATDEDGVYCDWIELYNAGEDTVDLSGWGVTDKASKPFKTKLPDGTSISAGQYLVVYCCKTYQGDENALHVAINLSSDGESVTLTSKDSTYTESVEAPALVTDTTYSRKPDGSENFSVLYPTPAQSNNEAEMPTYAPVFSQETGMYADPFDLSIESVDSSKIYYTLDGTDPSTSSTRIEYTQPLNIYNRSTDANVLSNLVGTGCKLSDLSTFDKSATLPKTKVDKGTVVRACTENSEGEYSSIVTKSYFVGISNATYDNIAVMNVTTDPANLFDYETGIYVRGKVFADWRADNKWATVDGTTPCNFNQRGREWERECHMDLFDSDGSVLISQDCGMRTQGAYSRADYQKSFRFYAREEYGEKNFKANIFDGLTDAYGNSLKKFRTLVVRNGGNDTDYTKFKDLYQQELVADRNVETQTGRACVVFIDGEYWGLYNLQEDYSDHYYENVYDVDSDEVIVYKTGAIDEGIEGEDEVYFDNMLSYAKNHDLSKAGYYEEFSKMIDIDSFIDYFAIETYLYNEDWPGNNYSMWRTRAIDESNPYADGRWRLNLYDTEMGTNHYGSNTTKYNANNLSKYMKNNNDPIPAIFNRLIKNTNFKEKFVTAFMDIANVNYNWDNCQELEKSYMADYYNNLTKYFARWPSWATRDWATDPCLNNMHTFLKNRAKYVVTMLKSDLSLGNSYKLNIETNDVNGGTVLLNTTTPDLSDGSFTGTYFADYPVTMTAVANEGYIFAGWRGTSVSNDATLTQAFTTDTTVKAVFLPADRTYYNVTFTDGEKTYTDLVEEGQRPSPSDSFFAKTGYNTNWTGLDQTVSSDKTLTCTYSPVTYKVKFMTNGGTGTSYTQTFTYDKAEKAKATFQKSGYAFYGWSETADGEAKYEINDLILNACAEQGKTVSLYAVWRKPVFGVKISAIPNQYFTGKILKPEITVKDGDKVLERYKDYALYYKFNIGVGTGSVTVIGRGDYIGGKMFTFKIYPGSLVNFTASSSGTTAKLSWKRQRGITGFEIYRSTSENGKYTKVATAKDTATAYDVKGLTKGKTYYFKVRAYTITANRYFYGKYTAPVSVKI